MNSKTLPSFWEAYARLNTHDREKAKRAFHLWADNPFHPSLHFKCVNAATKLWSVRIDRVHRAIGIWEGDTFTWSWIGNHDEYDRYLAG